MERGARGSSSPATGVSAGRRSSSWPTPSPPSLGIASGIGTNRYGAQLVVVADSRDEAVELGYGGLRTRRRRAGRFAAMSHRAGRGCQRGRGPGRRRMIRLGSLAGYPFEGPRLLGGWTPPPTAAVYAIVYKPEPEAKAGQYAVIYVGHSDDLSNERFPFKHPRAACWVQRSGRRWKVYICTYAVPGGGRSHREQIARSSSRSTSPRCNAAAIRPSDGRTSGSANMPPRRPDPLTTGRGLDGSMTESRIGAVREA